MRAIRRHDWSPRVELLPLIDVVFLLLTFFIYSLIMMVRAEILPVRLTTLTTGAQAEPAKIAAITIDAAGGLYLNREPIEPEQLDERLAKIAASDEPPKLFLAMEAHPPTEAGADPPPIAVVDRGPLLIRLIEQIRAAGIEDFAIVGQPQDKPPTNADDKRRSANDE